MIIDLLEAIMIILFGLSWPMSIYKSYTSRTAKGKCLMFEVLIWIVYGAGIGRKILQLSAGDAFDALFYLGFMFYIFNMSEVTVDILLYFRNRRLDRLSAKSQECTF